MSVPSSILAQAKRKVAISCPLRVLHWSTNEQRNTLIIYCLSSVVIWVSH